MNWRDTGACYAQELVPLDPGFHKEIFSATILSPVHVEKLVPVDQGFRGEIFCANTIHPGLAECSNLSRPYDTK